MNSMHRLELTCSAEHQDAWLNWLLAHYLGTIDVIAIKRYGLADTQLTRIEQVNGFANYCRFSITLDREQALTIRELALNQAQPIELSLLSVIELQ